jgi:phytol kinase
VIPPLLGIALVLGAFGALFLGLRAARAKLDPELSRKLLHLGMGLVSLSLPWIFSTTWPVIVLSSLAALAFLSMRVSSAMKREFGTVLHAVSRESFGEFFYTIGVAALFVLSHGDKLLYSIPLLTLTFADAVAALIGARYGSLRYATSDGIKSVEGSLACFGVAFLCVNIPLLLFSATGRLESLLIALILAFLVMLVEAVAWRGLDNLTIPLAGFALLANFIHLSVPDLVLRLVVVLVLGAFSFAMRRQTTLDDDALLAGILFGFVIWALGGWLWVLAPATLIINDARHGIRADVTQAGYRRHNVHAVESVCLAGLIWVVLAAVYGDPRLPLGIEHPLFFFAYLLSFAIHMAIFEATHAMHMRPQLGRVRALVGATLVSWVAIYAPIVAFLSYAHETRAALIASLISLPLISLAVLIFYAVQPGVDDCPMDTPRWVRQGSVALLVSALAAAGLWAAQLATNRLAIS